MTKRIEELVSLICGSQDHPLAMILHEWCLTSRPVLEFLEVHAVKLRKKIRLARSSDELADLLAELAMANVLARDRQFQVKYEPHPLAGGRSPDFQATFKGHTEVYLEVTRLRMLPEDQAVAASKLARVLCDKISQVVPGGLNVLTVVLPVELQTVTLVPAAVRRLLTPRPEADVDWRAEHLDTYRQLQRRLSGVLLCSLTPVGEPLAMTLWENPQAKRPLPAELARFLARPPGGNDDSSKRGR